jgi:bifunctional NMN adenylyltransferase/nudix hydrolase
MPQKYFLQLLTPYCTEATFNLILDLIFKYQRKFVQLAEEYQFIEDYKKQWASSPYPPVFVTADSLVLFKNHILVIRRKHYPGKDLYALPGGFINQTETLLDAAIRELKEETQIDIDENVLASSCKDVFTVDNPYRDERGRIITFVHFFDFNKHSAILQRNDFPAVKANDDANDVFWLSLSNLDFYEGIFYADHYSIIKHMIDKK